MSYLVEISGQLQGTDVTVYVASMYFNDNSFNLNMDKISDNGFSGIVEITTSDFLMPKIAKSPTYRDETFLWINITNPMSKFSVDRVVSNVPVYVTFEFNIFQFALYWCNKIFRKLLRITKLKNYY